MKQNYSGYGSHGDEVQATYGEPYGHVPRPSFDERAKSPTGDSVRSGGSGRFSQVIAFTMTQ